ncbi:L-lactate permease [Ornithinimicrobium tianjinense]|uniref:L-lactate permease n=1 Tax=Ornithinimicrobium tianjinense TaxID=1195761 RepID=A0A917BI06_9MICO|nr:L-lactate permease [Ornithinimicrobium tianjinense]GGF40834.1 hypothetical protein GCM10011366_05640 [Ornithinimicrobium tianjinense]
MLAVWAALPLVAVSVLLALRVRALHAALTGVLMVLVLVATVFTDGRDQLLPGVVSWLPTAVEVLVIIGGGIALSRIMAGSGAQGVLAGWLGRLTGGPVATALLVVHGVTPFAESVTGFGVGVLVGVPLLVAAGFAPHRAAVLGLLGLCAVPWGALGPGTIIAARLVGTTPDAMGVATAWPNTVVTVGVGVAAVLMVPGGRRPGALAAGVLSGLVLASGILLSSLLVAMAPSGALGGLTAIAAHLAWRRVLGTRVTLPGPVSRALVPYAVLLGGILASTATVRVLDLSGPSTAVSSPALWLVLTCLVAVRWLRLSPDSLGPLLREVLHLWRQTALPTAAFLGLGVLMVVGGLTTPLGRAIQATDGLALVAGPAVGAFGGFITGSSAAANSMFAAAQAAVAEGVGVSALAFVGVQNAAAAALTMANPARVLLALGAASAGLAPQDHPTLPRVTREVLIVCAVLVVALGLWNLLLL